MTARLLGLNLNAVIERLLKYLPPTQAMDEIERLLAAGVHGWVLKTKNLEFQTDGTAADSKELAKQIVHGELRVLVDKELEAGSGLCIGGVPVPAGYDPEVAKAGMTPFLSVPQRAMAIEQGIDGNMGDKEGKLDAITREGSEASESLKVTVDRRGTMEAFKAYINEMRASFVVSERQHHGGVRHPTTDGARGHDRRWWFKRLVAWTACCGSLSVALASQQNRAERQPEKSTWREYSFDLLGIRLSYPDSCEAWIKGGELFIRLKSNGSVERKVMSSLQSNADRAINGRILSQDGQYLLHLSLGSGDFHSANTRHRIFESSSDGVRVAFGRFQNPRAERLEHKAWKGYGSTIACSTFDEETGFHAAGGLCYWALVSDNSRYAVLDSTVLSPQEELMVRGIMKSLRFIKPKG